MALVWLSHSLQSEWQHVSNDFHLFLADEGLLFWGCPKRPEQRAVGIQVYMSVGEYLSVFVYPSRGSPYLLWTGLGPGQHTAYP